MALYNNQGFTGRRYYDEDELVCAEYFERINALVQQAQNLIDQSARIFDFVNLGISQAQISNYDDACAILEMSHRASQQFSETEMAELMELTIKLERLALEAKFGVFR